jgi:glycerol-1-phosphatase
MSARPTGTDSKSARSEGTRSGAGAFRVVRPGAAPRGPVELVALDLDGVVWRGPQVVPGAPEALADVVRRGLDLRYASNNSTAHRDVVSERLSGLGLPSGAERVLTSAFVAGVWLRERLPQGMPVMVVGEAGLLRELTEAGFAASFARDAAPGAPAPAAVVVGMDREFTFASLAAAQGAIMGGALFVATNRDATFPTPDRVVPGAGAMVAAVATAAQREPVVMGKPETALAEALASVTGVPAGRTLFIGDRLETDIDMAIAAGMISAMVLTGISTEGDLRDRDGASLPDFVLPDLRALPALLDFLGVRPA